MSAPENASAVDQTATEGLFYSGGVPAFLLKDTVAPDSSPTKADAEAPQGEWVGPFPMSVETDAAPAVDARAPTTPATLPRALLAAQASFLDAQDPDVQAQFRLRRLQAFNWGTFQGVADFPIAHEGYLFVGSSGSGKSTMLDGLAALTTPSNIRAFNAAAREADRGRSDRNLVTYVRGAWARQSNEEREAVQQFLRKGTTWSALAATYRNSLGASVSIVMLMWIRGPGTATRDLRHQYFVFEREFDVTEFKEPFADTDFDLKKLKLAFPEAFIREEFKAYQERFCRLLGIESDRALRLLHKTQSTKDLGELNVFLRDFMLDEPETFEVAGRLVHDFQDLNAAHSEVVAARKQIEALAPARENFAVRAQVVAEISALQAVDDHLDSYREERRSSLLTTEIETTKLEISHAQIAIGEAKGKEHHEKTVRDQYITKVQGAGGVLLQGLDSRIKEAEGQRQTRLAKQALVHGACHALEWPTPDTPQTFLKTQGDARVLLSGTSQDDELEKRRDPVKAEHERLSTRLSELRAEIDSMERQPSNIPGPYLRVRAVLATALGVEPPDLPFAGELMQVRPEGAEWSGAIERVLRGFSLSIVVSQDLYADFSRTLNDLNTGMRVIYHRAMMASSSETDRRTLNEDSLVRKVELARGTHQDWMRQQLRQHFDYECAQDMAQFRSSTRAVTKTGQVKHSATRHEKDDRTNLNNRREWVMGLDNVAKRQAFVEEAKGVGEDLAKLQSQLNQLTGERRRLQELRGHALTIANTAWEEMDIGGLLGHIAELQKQRQLEVDRNPDLEQLQARLASQERHYEDAVTKRQKAEGEERLALERLVKFQDRLEKLTVPRVLTAELRDAIDARVSRVGKEVTLESLDSVLHLASRSIATDRDALKTTASTLQAAIERVFLDYSRDWPSQSGGLDAKLESAPDFIAKLERLETDGLPRFEDRFMQLLQQQSNQNLATLQQRLDLERKQIYDRLDQVNKSLKSAHYNPGTHLVIEPNDRTLEDVKAFRLQLRDALSQAFTQDKAAAERRFGALSAMVKRLSSQESVDVKWRALVLDVRLHVDFRVRELDQDGLEREVYHSGAGKSGGQRQKLAAACLAAALRYQLGGQDRAVPSYATVVLDEAFDKADADFTAAAMTIFKTFGFQMVVATPMRSVMTLEPFIGGASVIHIVDGKSSRFSQVQYDTARGGLAFTADMRAVANEA
ncbi:ATP-binding protein [Hydrogenophaga palleronii]|uniref:ATP-binding protein n=1 Tax=Hydrogenophaga palleronii TaxID=65655 RepID=UPI0008253480|nr:SbcC/MukB-like Walker B domain-containing protein [Hydrogenophaga palleronii]